MPNASHSIREEIRGVLVFVGSIWAVFLVSLVFPSLDHYGVIPRTTVGLVGIPAMPFLHANLHHIVSNTVPLVVLLPPITSTRTTANTTARMTATAMRAGRNHFALDTAEQPTDPKMTGS